ncbi:hypothetical protein KAX02_11365 [candidate division WOR-3 bacterium]|nr:hypothetical protein [candidate division WOR-3 bacterium]
MIKSLIIIFAIMLFITPSFAQIEEEYTEEEAIQLIAAYGAREMEANVMAEKELEKIDNLKILLSEVEKEIAEIQERLREIEEEKSD